MGELDAEYYARRMREEEEAAARAAPVASAIHLELARKYAHAAREISAMAQDEEQAD